MQAGLECTGCVSRESRSRDRGKYPHGGGVIPAEDPEFMVAAIRRFAQTAELRAKILRSWIPGRGFALRGVTDFEVPA